MAIETIQAPFSRRPASRRPLPRPAEVAATPGFSSAFASRGGEAWSVVERVATTASLPVFAIEYRAGAVPRAA